LDEDPVLDGVQIPKGEGAILVVVRALAVFTAALAAVFAAKGINNVMQQKGSFSMPGKRK